MREREREKIVPMDKMLRFTNTIIIINYKHASDIIHIL